MSVKNIGVQKRWVEFRDGKGETGHIQRRGGDIGMARERKTT
jgi:hypothetical protein